MICLHIEADNIADLEARLRHDFAHLFGAPVVSIPVSPTATLAAIPAPAPVEADPMPEPPDVGPTQQPTPAQVKAAKAAAAAAAKAAKAEAEARAKAEADAQAATAQTGAPTIDDVRAVLTELSENHPDRGAIVVTLLKQFAPGAKNLSSADPSTYAALLEGAQELLADLAADPTA
jgi:hypothetical protein